VSKADFDVVNPMAPSSIRILLIASFTLLTACGGDYETEHVKDYRLAVVSGTDADRAEIRDLIQKFNDDAGVHVLTFVESADEANSAVLFVPGLESKTKAVTGEARIGQAQWFMETSSENPMSTMGRNPKRTVTYTMRIELDAEYMRERRDSTDADKIYDKQKLFFHEVGHGLELRRQQRHVALFPVRPQLHGRRLSVKTPPKKYSSNYPEKFNCLTRTDISGFLYVSFDLAA